jgi:hypothetical protein
VRSWQLELHSLEHKQDHS